MAILLHGRGASAEDILSLAREFGSPRALDDVAYLAPQAAGNSWYPYSFLAPIPQNEPALTSALGIIGGLVTVARQRRRSLRTHRRYSASHRVRA